MAIRVRHILYDDLDASTEGVHTHHIGLDGVVYEIDLTEANLARLREALAPLLSVGRRLPKTKATTRAEANTGPTGRRMPTLGWPTRPGRPARPHLTPNFDALTFGGEAMRVIDIPPAPVGRLDPIPPEPADTESVAITWCREIATAGAAALDTEASDVGYRLTLHPNLAAPHTLHTAFTVTPTGTAQPEPHTVRIAVVWDNLWREPGFALAVDDQPVNLDTTSPARAAVVLAHAAWQAVSDHDAVGVR